MRPYLISYDLMAPSKDYSALLDALRRLGAIHTLKSVWILTAPGNAAAVRDHLRRFIDANDKLIVLGLDGADWATFNAPTTATAWLKTQTSKAA